MVRAPCRLHDTMEESAAGPLQRQVDRVHGVLRLGGDAQVDRKAIVLPPGSFELFDPFLMMAEDWFSSPGFDWHPHRGIETVTFVLEGALEHGDSRGNAGVLEPGDVQWMTAGSGIIHRELAHRDEHAHTLQLWVNLPASHKMVESGYQDLSRQAMAQEETRGARVAGASGRLGGRLGPARTLHPTTVLQIEIEPGGSYRLVLPAEDRAFLYLRTGRLVVGEQAALAANQVAWTDPVGSAGQSSVLDLRAPDGDEPSRAVLASGRPLGEPVVAGGPFVMNSEAEIRQAYDDFRRGRFGPIPRLARVGA